MSFHVRPMAPDDFAGVVDLQRACFPPPFAEDHLWRVEHLEAHLARFPEGQFVAVAGERVVGSASAAIIPEPAWLMRQGWEETLGGFAFDHHDPDGTTLYGADISVSPEFQGRGVGRALYQARFGLVRALGLARYGTACRIPGFSSSGLTCPATYVGEVVSGATADRTLTPLLSYGLRCVAVLRDYMHDPESGHCAALLEWTP